MSFPLNNNDPYIKSTGERSTLGAELAKGGTSELPEYGLVDAGKVLTVGDDGKLEWDTKGTGGGIIESHYEAYTSSSTQTRTYEKTVIIPEDGYYLICIGTYVDNFSLKINDVAESETGTISQDFVHTYFNAAKQLHKDDEVAISLTSSGRAVFTSIIVKTEAPTT